ncbi:IS5 family transposase ISSgr2 [Streptomyces sp. enrichment culture]
MRVARNREGDRRRKLRPSQRALVALVYLREHTTLAKIAAEFSISEATVHAYVHSVTEHLAAKAPSLLRALRRVKFDHVLVDSTIAECNRAGDWRADYSGKARRHGVNIQAITDPSGRLV